jgi:hypothetical protein
MRKCGKIERVYHGWGRPFGGGSGDWRGGYGASLEDRKAVMKKVLIACFQCGCVCFLNSILY